MASNVLFKDTADLRKIIPNFHASADDAEIFPYLEEGAIKYLIPFIDQGFYDEMKAALVTANYDTTTMSAENKLIINHLRLAEAYYGLYEALPFLLSNISTGGMRELNPEGANTPRQWVANMTNKSAIQKADLFLDKALEVMEGDPNSYATWKASAAFTIHHKFLVTRASEFTGINGSRRTYMRLINYMQLAEDRYVLPAIGADLLSMLKAKKEDATAYDTYETQLTTYLYQALSYYALFLGGPELKLDISNEGIRLASTNDGITGLKPPMDNKIIGNTPYGEWLMRMERNGAYYLAKAKEYLDRNASNFSDYDGSEAADKTEPNYAASQAISGTSGSVMI